MTQRLDIEEVGNETINVLVRHNSRQLRYFETILTACAEELGLCSDVANPLLCDLSRHQVARHALRILSHADLADAVGLKGRPPQGVMKPSLASKLMRTHPAPYMRVSACLLDLSSPRATAVTLDGMNCPATERELAKLVEYHRRSSNNTIYSACKLAVHGLRLGQIDVGAAELQAIYRKYRTDFPKVTKDLIQFTSLGMDPELDA